MNDILHINSQILHFNFLKFKIIILSFLTLTNTILIQIHYILRYIYQIVITLRKLEGILYR